MKELLSCSGMKDVDVGCGMWIVGFGLESIPNLPGGLVRYYFGSCTIDR